MNTTTTNIAGSVTGSNLNFRSRLENVSQSIGQLPDADQSTIQELTQLLGQLQVELKKLSDSNPDRGEQIEAVAASIEELVNQAKQKNPNQIPLQQAIAEAEASPGN